MDTEGWLAAVFDRGLRGSPRRDVAEWAGRNVYLGPKMTPTPGYFDLRQTPWTKRVMNAIPDPEIRKVVVQKSSRTGFTEAALNGIRWLPAHMPGPALYAINSDKKAREVSKVRLIPTLHDAAPAEMTGRREDVTMARIEMREMYVDVSGSGSAGAYMEGWYLLIVLDEYEEHSQEHEETTADRAEGRQVNVDYSTLVILSKPQLEGGPINGEYKRGSQEKYWVPCPRCERRQELVWDRLRFDGPGTKDLVGQWNLEAVREAAWYECRHCHGRIEEHEKRAMVNEGLVFSREHCPEGWEDGWVPEPRERRFGVEREPGVVSQQINDLYSLHPKVRWGELAVKFLSAFRVNPSESKRKFFWTNHLGLAWQRQRVRIYDTDLEKLRGGALVKDSETGEVHQLGREYSWSHDREGRRVAGLPVRPAWVTMTCDKQGNDIYKWVVGVWTREWELYIVDYGTTRNSVGVQGVVEGRRYVWEGGRGGGATGGKGEEFGIDRGLIDARFGKKEVVRLCIATKFRLMPAMGHGDSSSFSGRSIRNNRVETIEGRNVRFYDFYNHDFETDLYVGKIKRREKPRLWLPTNCGEEFGQELRSTRLVVNVSRSGRQTEEWKADEDIANDWGDAVKLQYVLRECYIGERGEKLPG